VEFKDYNEIVETLNRQGHEFSFKQVPKKLFATLFPGAAAIAETFSYFQFLKGNDTIKVNSCSTTSS